jgi:hypothetical protein
MNTNTETKPSIVDALFDLGLAWAEVGLVQGKTALETTAKALAKTAQSLDAIRERLASEVAPTERMPEPDQKAA